MLGKLKLRSLNINVNKGGVALLVMGVLVAAMVPVLSKVSALNGTWVDGSMPVLTLGKQLTEPTPPNCFQTSWNYHSYTNPNGTFNSLGRVLSTDVCATENGLGLFGANTAGSLTSAEWIKPNTAIAFRVVNANQQRALIPVPHQSSFIIPGTDNQSNLGSSIYRFFDNFGQAGNFEQVANQTFKELAFQITPFTVQPLQDANGTNLQLRNRAFSNNGKWMAVELQGFGFARVNTQTREILLFSKDRFTYGLGFVPFVSLAISDDGNTVVQTGRKVYDLSGCQQVPFTYLGTNNLPGCRERSIDSLMFGQGVTYLDKMSFSADGLSVSGEAYIVPPAGGAWTRHAMTLSVAGYQPVKLSYLGIGDSFSSGEGTFNYLPGTNEDENMCHLSTQSYPYLAAGAINSLGSFHNVACSKSTVLRDYYSRGSTPRYPVIPENAFSIDWLPGSDFQSDFVAVARPDAVTVSMIGNDIGFESKIRRCIAGPDSCFHFKEDRDSIVYEIHNKFDTLVHLYQNIKSRSDGGRVYVLGYPNLFSESSAACGTNVIFDEEERAMARGLTGYLNAVIKAATQKAGVVYIDVEHAFAGHELCDSGQKAVNGLTIGDDIPAGVGPLGMESYHPNALGHQLMAQSLLAQSENLTKAMPVPSLTATAPYIGSSAYNEFVNGVPTGGVFRRVTYTGFEGLNWVARTTFRLQELQQNLFRPVSPVQVWLHSDPVQIGAISTDFQGNIDADVTIPPSVEPGFHTLHLVGKDVANETVEMYKTIYVAESQDDFDGDGILNADDTCLVVEPSGLDVDQDGLDDTCDPEITDPPADSTPPVVASTPDRQPNEAGWYNGDVIINWASVDPEPSSGEPTQPAPTLADQEGVNTYISDQSCDPASNCATGSIELKIDKTAPQISYTIDPATSSGWNQPGVTVSFECLDATSGIATCPAPQTFNGADGTYQIVESATDFAGNTSQVTTTVQLDSAAPLAGTVEWTGNPKLTTATAIINVPFNDLGSGVTEAEYYLGDTDPGVGNGATMQVGNSAAWVAFGTDFPTGVYKVTVRAKDLAGNWSQPVSDFLVVYNTDGVRITGKRFSFPSLTNGDILPGLQSDSQGDKAKFGFSIKYGDYGSIHPNSDFQFSYQTGDKCNKPAQAQNCHKLEFNATSIDWLTTQGYNDSTGIFQGVGRLEVDGAVSTVPFRVTGLDGERLDPTSADRVAIYLYQPGDNPFTATTQYRVDAEVERGNIKIRKPLLP